MNVKLINKEKEEELKELREQSINIINDKEMVGWYIEFKKKKNVITNSR